MLKLSFLLSQQPDSAATRTKGEAFKCKETGSDSAQARKGTEDGKCSG